LTWVNAPSVTTDDTCKIVDNQPEGGGRMTGDERHFVGVVDDDPAVVDAVQFLLALAGHCVIGYRSALAFLDATPPLPACLILDQHMPGMTGLVLAERLREAGHAIPVLLMTGSPSPAIAARAAELGIERVLDKPPGEADLLNFIESHIPARGRFD
jgi:FixJ family two-component response regulator